MLVEISPIFRFMDKRMMLKLNGGRTVSGILRGFDPFMNVVIDETVEECRDGTKNNIGMVVCIVAMFYAQPSELCLSFWN